MATNLDHDGGLTPATHRRRRAAYMAGSTLPERLARDRLVSETEAATLVSLGRSTWRRLWQAGKAPAPVRVTPHRMAWRLGGVLDWAAGRPVIDVDAAEGRLASPAPPGRRLDRGASPAAGPRPAGVPNVTTGND